MACFMQPTIVSYVCSCGILNPITKLYFCRYCLKLRCGFCVCHEVDSHFCSNCLENIPSTEAKHKKNRCNSCFDCPSCQHTLTARATTVAVPRKSDDAAKDVKEGGSDNSSAVGAGEDDGKTITRKMYYLGCLACRWTSRDVGIPDQTIATGSWPEYEYANQTRFNNLLEHYQAVVLLDKQEKQDYWRRKNPKQHKFPSLTDRTGLTISMIRRQMGWPDKTPPKPKLLTISPSVATDDVDDLPESLFTKELNLKNITTIKQRHGQPADQPKTANKLFPQRKSLSVKRSLRCRQCEHNVIKPEYHPTSIKYRLQLFASYHVPDVRLVNHEKPLKPGQPNKVILKLSNPTAHDITITIMELPTEEEESLIIEDLKKSFERQTSLSSTTTTAMVTSSSLTGLSRQTSLNEEPRFVKKRITGSLELPDSSFMLNRKDDSAEYDEIQVQREDPRFIVWRCANKASIKLSFTPNKELQSDNEVIIGFSMLYTYVNTVTSSPEKREPQHHALTSRVYIKVGTIQSN